MTHIPLQHVVVRMLHDPVFVDSVYADPQRALEGVGLTPRDIDWIHRTDPRAWRTDPHRRARALTGLLEEYPTSAACLVRHAHRQPPVAVLDEFFSSPEFHRGIQDGRSLAIVFGEFLARSAESIAPTESWAPSLARLELGIARLRRVQQTRPPVMAPPEAHGVDSPRFPARLRTAPTLGWLYVLDGTLDRFGAIRKQLATREDDARGAIVDLTVDIGSLVAIGQPLDTAPVLLSAQLAPAPAIGGWLRITDVEISPIAGELASVLEAAAEGADIRDLLALISGLGVDEAECREVLTDLVRDGILTPV